MEKVPQYYRIALDKMPLVDTFGGSIEPKGISSNTNTQILTQSLKYLFIVLFPKI